MPFFDIEDVLKFSVIPKHEDLTKPCLSVLDIYDPIIKKQEFRFRAGGKDLSSNIKDVEQMFSADIHGDEFIFHSSDFKYEDCKGDLIVDPVISTCYFEWPYEKQEKIWHTKDHGFWKISGVISSVPGGWMLVEEFRAFTDTGLEVKGNFNEEKCIEATSKEAFRQFFTAFPPLLWDPYIT